MSKVIQDDTHTGPMVEISIWQTEALQQLRGNVPQEQIARHIATALSLAEVNYEIIYDRANVITVPEPNGICNEPFGTWNTMVKEGIVDGIRKDSNMLLTTNRGGGCSNNPNNDPGRCIVGCERVSDTTPYSLQVSDPNQHACHAAMHELAHNLGMFHSDHGGLGFMRGGQWHRTPSQSGGSTNMCDEDLGNRQGEIGVVKYLFFNWCMVKKFDIEGHVGDLSPPSTFPPRWNGSTPVASDRFRQIGQSGGGGGEEPPEQQQGFSLPRGSIVGASLLMSLIRRRSKGGDD